MKKFKKVIKSHHLKKVFELIFPSLNLPFDQSPDFDPNFSEDIELNKPQIAKLTKVIEVELFLQTLYLAWLVKCKQIEEAQKVAQNLIAQTLEINKRYNDNLASVIYFYLSRSYELAGKLSSVRDVLLQAYRNSTLNHDEQGQAVLLNLLLRNYLHYNDYTSASNLVSKTDFPEQSPGNE